MDFLQKKKHKVLIPPLNEDSDGSDFIGSPSTTLASSPASSEGGKSSMFFQAFKDRARRSFSLESLPVGTPPRETSVGAMHHRKLSKSRNSSSAFEILSRRSSGFSEDLSPFRSGTALSTHSESTVDWKSQNIEGVAPLERDPQLLRNKNPYIVITSDYVVKMKGQSDTMALFPKLSAGTKTSTGPPPEPLLTIPIHSIVSVFVSESTRPSFGMEVWWRVDGTLGFKHTVFYFNLPGEREEQMQHLVRAVTANNKETSDYTRFPWEVSAPIRRLFADEEPSYQHQELNIFPVVPRGATRKEGLARDGDKQSKNGEGKSYYLAIGAHLCCYIEITKGQAKRGELILKHSRFGLVTLQRLRGHWTPHEERFIISFRDPFKQAVTLELASRYYRSIIRVLHKADRYLKPAWPQMLQNNEVFHISGLREPQYVIDRDDYGGIKRTLDAYCAAYRCKPVDWEISWRTKYSPEFRLLPSKTGTPYAPMQLLAVMRALRYNDYFVSLNFRGIDLSVLWDWYDRCKSTCEVPYLTRSCMTLGAEDVDNLMDESVLYNEIHALAYCSEKVRQIDFTDTFKQLPVPTGRRAPGYIHSIQILSPVFHLLELGATKCNRLLLGGNELSEADISSLTYICRTSLLQALDVSRCGLCDLNLRDLLSALSCHPQSLQVLDLSGNNGRVPAVTVPNIIHLFTGLKELNLGGCLIGTVPGSLIPCEALERMSQLRELDISQYKVNDATILHLEEYLLRGNEEHTPGSGATWTLRRLALNNCGITGRQAAKLFDAIGEARDFDLSLNGNPLEEGIDYLANSIRHNRGPRELHMDMVEFRDEANYCILIRALTATQHLTSLSLVGTGPTPPAGEPLESETCEALEKFFAYNTSIRHLNYSGYKGKLDEGQMAPGFGLSLRGLAENETLTHLWIKNQNLHDDIGTLGTVLRKNRSLQVLDCQNNGFNMTTLQFLVESVKENYTLVSCPFTQQESEKIWAGIRDKIRGPRTGLGAKRPSDSMMIAREALLKEHYEALLAELKHYLDRNQRLQNEAAAARAAGPIPERRVEEVTEGAWMARSERSSSSSSDGDGDGDGDGDRSEEGTPRPQKVRRQTIRSSGIAINTSLATPYQVLPEEGMESPTETIGPVSGMSASPPEATTPTTPDDASYLKMAKEFKDVVL